MNCVFCKITQKEISSKILYEDENYISFLDLDQEIIGNTIVTTKKHYKDYTELDNEILYGMFQVAQKVSKILEKKLNAKGFSYTINYLESQEIKHVHIHIFPNYQNRQTIDEVYEKIKNE